MGLDVEILSKPIDKTLLSHMQYGLTNDLSFYLTSLIKTTTSVIVTPGGNVTTVPVPASVWLFGSGIICMTDTLGYERSLYK